jgi:sugar O-acyltransferase (sialic acid O-acetyltransferase NeuD family)
LTKPLVIIGGGGHASVLLDILLQQDREILGFVCPKVDPSRSIFSNIQHYANDSDVLNWSTNSIRLVNGLGSLPNEALRNIIYENFCNLGYEFETVIANSANVSGYSKLAQGCQILPGAIVQTGAQIGENTIINSGVIIEHDCKIGKNNHIAPNAVLSGGVMTQQDVHVGTGASIIQSIKIGANAIVGAGATVVKNIEASTIVYGAKNTIKVRQNES